MKKKTSKANKQLERRSKKDSSGIKTTGKMNVLRITLWIMLCFIFFRGIVSCLSQTKEKELRGIITEFKEEYYGTQDNAYKVLGFAQDFCQEYLTYEVAGSDSFLNRIRPFVTEQVLRNEGIYDFKNTCDPVYINAYRKEDISATQCNVYVTAKLKYSIQELQEDDTFRNISKMKEVTLMVPVHMENGHYIVNALPIFVKDYELYDSSYAEEVSIPGEEVDSKDYKECVVNFLKAYYGEEQNVLNYFLSADSEYIICIGDYFEFEKIQNLRSFKDNDSVFCNVFYKIQDKANGTFLLQNMCLEIILKDSRQYVKSMRFCC